MTLLHFAQDSRARTIFGWTPGLRTLLNGRILPCGCLAGTYQAWNKQVVVILDERSAACSDAHHRRDAVLWASASGSEVRVEYDEVSPGAGVV